VAQPIVPNRPLAGPPYWRLSPWLGLVGAAITTWVSHRYVIGAVLATGFLAMIIGDVVRRRRAT
jgi:hypothetical protein